MTRLQLAKEIKDRTVQAEPKRAPDRFFACKVCGQSVDRLNLEAVFHHDDKPHLPA